MALVHRRSKTNKANNLTIWLLWRNHGRIRSKTCWKKRTLISPSNFKPTCIVTESKEMTVPVACSNSSSLDKRFWRSSGLWCLNIPRRINHSMKKRVEGIVSLSMACHSLGRRSLNSNPDSMGNATNIDIQRRTRLRCWFEFGNIGVAAISCGGENQGLQLCAPRCRPSLLVARGFCSTGHEW